MGKLSDEEKMNIKERIIKVQEGFEEFAETLEDDAAFDNAINELIDYVMEL